MRSVDYDVLIIGSGFGGSVAALRATEKGYRVGVMEAGRRWRDEDIPKTNWDLKDYLWFPAAELYGLQRIEYLDDVLILCGAGVGGGSHVYGNTLMSLRSSSSRLQDGRVLPTGLRSWRLVTTRRGGCSASFAIRICLRTWIGTCSKSRPRWAEGKPSTRRRWVSSSAAPASKPRIRISAGLDRAAPDASPAATARWAVATTPRTS